MKYKRKYQTEEERRRAKSEAGRLAAGKPYAMPDSSEWIVREVA